MADKHSLNYDVRELKLGASFTNNKTSQYHTIKYDFKPASVDVNKMASVDVGTNNQVTVTVPHLDGAGVPQTVFKGSQRPYTKECVLIIDRVTGEITLEKLSSNIQVKKTRQESTQKPRPLTPVTTDFTNTTQRSTSRTRVATNKRTQPNPGFASSATLASGAAGVGAGTGAGGLIGQARYNGAAPGKPPGMMRSPPRVKTSPPQAAPWSGGGNSTLASLPMIGLDDLAGPSPPVARDRTIDRRDRDPAIESAVASLPMLGNDRVHDMERLPERLPDRLPERMPERLPERLPERQPERYTQREPVPVSAPVAQSAAQDDSSSSSSSDSDSDSGSGSDSEDHDATQVPLANGNISGNPALPSDVLNDDLCLSESGSESD